MGQSEISKKLWQDPAYRERQRVSRLTAYASPEVRARMSTSHSRVLEEQWKDPEYRERQSTRLSEFAKTRQGTEHPSYKHGKSHSPEYQAFHQARQRCLNQRNPQWPEYGGRGILFLFTSFGEFLEHIGTRPSSLHSLDRIQVNGNYQLGNVRWATATVQIKNRRKFNCLSGFTDAELITEVQRRNLDVPKKQPRFVIDAA